MSDELKKLRDAIDAQKRIVSKQEIVSQEEHLPVRDLEQDEADQSNQNSIPDQSE